MVESGSIIKAVVDQIEPFGIWLLHGQEKVLVLIPDVSWTAIKDIHQVAKIGDVIDVYVLRYNYQDKTIVGSLRHLHPDQDPYRQLAKLEPGVILLGKVQSLFGGQATIVLPNGARGYLDGIERPPSLKVGDEIPVAISSLEIEQRTLTLKRINPDDGSVNGIGMHPPISGEVLTGSTEKAPQV